MLAAKHFYLSLFRICPPVIKFVHFNHLSGRQCIEVMRRVYHFSCFNINHYCLGNNGSALVEVLVGRSSWSSDEQFQVKSKFLK